MYLGIDCGTQGTKVLVLDPQQQQVLGEGYAPHQLISEANGRREQEASWWTDALVAAYRQALEQSGIDSYAIRAIGISGQQHGLVVLDKAGEVIRPAKLWCDTETAPQNAELLQRLGGETGSLEQLGLVLATGYTLSKLLWLQQHEPESFSRIAHILLPHDYLNYWLTGEITAEYGDASGSGYFNIRTRRWTPEILELIDNNLTSALPPLLEAQHSAGKIKADIAKLLGLNPEVIVASGGGDNMMGAIGTGNIQDGIVTMSLGTSGALYAYSSRPPQQDPKIAAFCSSNNGWLPLICTMNLTGVVNTVRQLFGYELDAFTQAVSDVAIGCDGLTMLPFLNGERVPPLPHATGSFLGLNMQNTTPGHFCRAAMEATSFGLRYGLDLLQNAGIKSHQIRLIGGGSKSPLWRQMIADMMNADVVCPTIGEGAALGAAIQAAWCDAHSQGTDTTLESLCQRYVVVDEASAVSPNPEAVAAYATAYAQYRHHLSSLYPEL